MAESEHRVARVNDGWYVCDKCGDTGSERWAILHQFPSRSEDLGGMSAGPREQTTEPADWKLQQIREALEAYEWALKQREHGAVAANRFIRAVAEIVGGDQ